MTYNKSYRPRLAITPTSTDKLLDILGYLVLAALLVVPLLYINQLPDEIPTHFNGLGEADAVGGKNSLCWLPGLGVLLFLILTLLLRIPHHYNYPVTLHEQNAEIQYAMALTLMRNIRFFTTGLFLAATIKTIAISLGKSAALADAFVWIGLLAVIIVPIYYILKARKYK